MGALEKAFLTVEGKSSHKIPCMFNPETISITKTNTWNSTAMPGQHVQEAQFAGQEAATMSLHLFFDTTDTGKPVTNYTGEILALMDLNESLPDTDDSTNNARPSYVTFHWGRNLTSFPAVITIATVSFEYFSSQGVPLRAKMDLTLKQYQQDDAYTRQNPTSGTPQPHRVHRVQPGETLDRISARYYGDSTRWRLLAGANAIEDPLALRPGSLLSVPMQD